MDSYVRCRAFWGIYSMDMEFGAILGRPGTLVDVNYTCPRAPRWHEDDLVIMRVPQMPEVELRP